MTDDKMMEMEELSTSDLSRLNDLSEENILRTLKERYSRDLIYTSVKDILIAINPCKPLDIYNTKVHYEYNWDNFDANLPPHVFQVVANAYRRIRETETNQVIIVSGESGAGKTESAKHMVRHVVHICQRGEMELHDKIVKINPLLEAFGNAKTTVNANSSRFAKYLELRFKEGQLAGAIVRDYILEKSRVVHRNDNEGNFHFFYALFAGCSEEKRNDLFISSAPEQFRIMRSDPERLRDRDHQQWYRQMYTDCMSTMISIKVDTEILHAMLAAVLNITDIEFYEDARGTAQIQDAAPYVHAALLLSLDEMAFAMALITSQTDIHGEKIATHKTLPQAEAGRDALAKMLYERLFGWLVRQINQDLHPNKLGVNDTNSIGILDIAGFEKLEHNSLEQLCINLVNEKLQHFMNVKIFKEEIEIYKGEGISLDDTGFKNNDRILDMFVEQNEVLDILNEQSVFQQGTDTVFVMQLKKNFSDTNWFSEVPGDRPDFVITHFAGDVCYEAMGFREKNRDLLNIELMDCMKGSSDEFISDLFKVRRGPTGTISETRFEYHKSRRGVLVIPKGKVALKQTPKGQKLADELGMSLRTRFGTVGKPEKLPKRDNTQTKKEETLVSYFRKSLSDLLDKLRCAEHFYVKCLKANKNLDPNNFDEIIVSHQLRYNGLSEVVKIRKMGFAMRTAVSDFSKRYICLLPINLRSDFEKDAAGKHIATHILKLLPEEFKGKFREGKTSVFMTHEINLWLEERMHTKENSAARIITRVMKRVVVVKKEEKRKQSEIEARKRAEQYTRYTMPGAVQTGRASPKLLDEIFPKIPFKYNVTADTVPQPPGDVNGSKPGNPGNHLRDTVPSPPGVIRPPTPPRHIDSNRPEFPTTDQNPDEKKKDSTAFWDVCQIIARELKQRDVDEDRGLQLIKVVTYFLLFCIILWCVVCQKISLMILVSPQYNRISNRTESKIEEDSLIAAGRHILITIAIVIPYILLFLSSFFKWLFGTFTFPRPTTLITCFIIELFHTLGLCVLCFHVLPELDMPRGIMLLSGVAIVPAVLFPVCASEVKNESNSNVTVTKKTFHKIGVFILNIATLLIQCGYIPFIVLTDFFMKESTTDNEPYEIVFFFVAMVLISFVYWENFVDDRFCGRLRQSNCWTKFILGVKFDLQESRPVVSVFTSLWKIGLTVLISYLYKVKYHLNVDNAYNNIDGVTFSDAIAKLGGMNLIHNSSILTLTLTAFLGHYIGYTACKLKLQKVSFNIALILSTPIAVVITAVDCYSPAKILSPFTTETRACFEENAWQWTDHWIHYLYGFVAFVSLYWLGRHIFYPNIERLAKRERLFVNPFYCGILLEQHLLLNRRRHNRRVYKELKESKQFFRLSEFNSKVNIEGEEVEDKDGTEEDVLDDSYRNKKFRDIPMIYACATMWHENKVEMTQLMKSLYRMDRDQNLRRTAELVSGKDDKDFYDFEAHIFFDDAMELDDNDEWVPNKFVRLLMSVQNEAASSVYQTRMAIKDPFKVPTPYGGQLIFRMPGDNFLFVHMKDKMKIRHRKRWSQVMYMYYLLGFRIVRMCQETVTAALNSNKIGDLIGWEGGNMQISSGQVGRSHIFQAFDEQVLRKANNTFLLALDGDVDFSPGAVRLLLDRMRKSEKVGAACGRIHPIGTGPVVWFQKFEYAIAHWLQKATEHVLGCVLCSPGCFSMFRGSALMDDNVMKKYTILPTEAAHHLMYDQGEDRWLCTLLLQQGYRVDYAAGSDAFTYAPEAFDEFFNQRRRWMPSTVFNIIDLLADYKNTVHVNSNISMLYIFYQGALLFSTVVGPATVLMMIAGANLVVFKVNLINSYLIALIPAIVFFIACFFISTKRQIQFAEILTGFYAFIMMIVLVGTIVTAVKQSLLHPSVIFIVLLIVAFCFAALLHPKEWSNVIYGALYFLMIPSGFLLLIIYSLCNMHVVSWGTREVPKRKTPQEIEEEKKREEEKKKKKQEQGFFGRFFPQFPTKDLKELLNKFTDTVSARKETTVDVTETNKLLKDISESMHRLVEKQHTQIAPPSPSHEPELQQIKSILRTPHVNTQCKSVQISENITVNDEVHTIYDKVEKKRNDLVNPAWAECKELGKGSVMPMKEEELAFWERFIEKYLKPLDLTAEQKKNSAQELIDLRNNIALGMAMINLLWIAVNFMFQLESPTKVSIPNFASAVTSSQTDTAANLEENMASSSNTTTADNITKVDVLGLLFIIFYLVILLVQFVGMIMHRWGTLLHLLSITKLKQFDMKAFKRARQEGREDQNNADIGPAEARRIVEEILTEPTPNYDSDDDDNSSFDMEARTQLETLQKTGSRFRISTRENTLGATSRIDRTTDSSVSERRATTITNLLQSVRVIRDGLDASRGRHVTAPEREIQIANIHDDYLKQFVDVQQDRPSLPPVLRRKRLNLGPGRSELAERLKRSHLEGLQDRLERTSSTGPRIPEGNGDDDPIYDQIRRTGTVGRHLSKKLQLYANRNVHRPRVSFNVTASGRPANMANSISHRSNDSHL